MDLPDAICDLMNRQRLITDPEALPNSPTMRALLPSAVDCFDTSRKAANDEMAEMATGELNTAYVVRTEGSATRRSWNARATRAAPTVHGRAPNRRS